MLQFSNCLPAKGNTQAQHHTPDALPADPVADIPPLATTDPTLAQLGQHTVKSGRDPALFQWTPRLKMVLRREQSRQQRMNSEHENAQDSGQWVPSALLGYLSPIDITIRGGARLDNASTPDKHQSAIRTRKLLHTVHAFADLGHIYTMPGVVRSLPPGRFRSVL